jgi:esterase/lipase superfamily enzyme
MFSSLALLIASHLLLMSDREHFWNPDKISTNTEILWEENHKAVSSSFEGLKDKKVLLLVHGYNNSIASTMQTYHLIKKNIEKIEKQNGSTLYDVIIGYVWPGYQNTLEYYAAKENAHRLAKRLRSQLGHLSAATAHIDVLAHSMGNRLVLEALNVQPVKPLKKIVQNFYSLAAAVDGESIEKNQKYYNATLRCQNIYVFYSKRDDVLKFYYAIAEFDEALGYEGTESRKKLPRNVQLLDCSLFIKEHSQYFTALPFYEFIRKQRFHELPPISVESLIQVVDKGGIEIIPKEKKLFRF